MEYAIDLIKEKTMTFIEEHMNTPFFLYLAVAMPHDNGEAPEGERLEIPDLKNYFDSSWSLDDQRLWWR
jgi:hypothetical protein